MTSLMSIGDFSRATRLSAKTLRFYHQVGLLRPAQVDSGNGYRRYDVEQVERARAIRSYRQLDMPIDVIRDVLRASTPASRNHLIEGHLAHMEDQLKATQSAVESLRRLLQPPQAQFIVRAEKRPAIPVGIIRETIDLVDLGPWYERAMEELDQLTALGVATGHRGGVWETELFMNERGEAAVFVPLRSLDVVLPGRVRAELLPAVDLVTALHEGTDDTIGDVYAALGRFVAENEISVDSPIRETYLTYPGTSSTGVVVTEIGWPVMARSR